ncbi:AAA domain-containing protein [Micromonospora sp. R77]|uniref:AAA domain-containing protein n=1 Tax=Micromonospora sp. R77 TaxID=2925836 RepID=UPI001F61439C|nr:AAA domain-containing protein [Micromonospora sp. R77]MCI4064495.1 AAA domain-containing protein [Micromonospora sp. R77]
MFSRSTSSVESPALILDRATSLVDYLMAVRAQMEKPARTVPTGGAFWQHAFPTHPACEVGVSADGTSWLRVGLPAPARSLRTPTQFAAHLNGPVSYDAEPRLVGPEAETEPLQAGFEAWREQEWRPWARQARRIEDVRRLHRSLFDLKHRVDMNAATDELVWGHGVIRAKVAGHRVHYPLVVTPVAIEFDADRSLVTAVPQGAARLQTDPLSGLDERYLAQLLALAGSGGQLDLDVWDEFTRREFLERALRRLGQDPVVRDADQPAPAGPHVHDTGVLFIRPRQRMLRRFLEQLRARLLAGDDSSIGALAAILAHEPSKLLMPQDQPERWAPLGERLLMPLPTNEAQESIARRLAQHRNVAVQGPPGTGKTHTIRNLICHLMAHGKRVLVVAQKEDPLRVLRDGLPQEIQSLCLAVLGRSTDQLVQLQLAARELSDRGATLDRRGEQQRVDRLRRQLEKTERDLGQALGGLRTMAENEAAHHEIDGIRLSPSDVGVWLRERADRYGDIPDDLPPHLAPPLSGDEFTELLDIARRTTKQDRLQALRDLPTAADLPSAAAVLANRGRLEEATRELNQLAAAGVALPQVRAFGPQPLDDLAAQLRESLTLLAARENSWTDRLGTLLQADPHWHQLWYDHVQACQRALGELTAATRVIAGHQVTVPDTQLAEPRRLLAQLGDLRQRFAAGKAVSRLFQATLAKLAAECLIDGEILRTCNDVDIVVAYVGRQRLRQELTTRWQEWTQPLELPVPAGVHPETWAGRLLAQAESALDWDRRRWPALHATLRGLLPTIAATVDTRRLTAITDLVARSATVFARDQLVTAERELAAAIEAGMSGTEASELWRLLDVSRRRADLDGWDACLDEVRRLAALRPDAERFRDLSARLRDAAPGWTATIDDGTAPALAGSGADCLHRWQWRQAQTWFDTVVGSVDPVALGRRIEQTRERIRRLTQELVVASSWLEVSKALDDRRRAALADWTTALRKIGKGTGKNAAQWQAHAQRAMSAAVDAVPVWVMSVDRAIEQFAGGAQFDVVIVDEASQADMFSLPILSLAERAVVVGDDQQIGPQLSFVGTVNGLINSHLVDVPSAEHFDPESSLYDHAVRRSPERILLTEHFRSVPAIIGFSSQTYYGGEIEPLRTDRPAGIGDPVIAVHVPEGIRQDLTAYGNVNVAEADALVDRVAAIVANPAYAGRTIGVVSLLSTSGQALYLLTRIREAVGEEEMERRRLRVGDSYTFQGDERDIVLLSLVVSPHQGPVSAFTKRDHHRRVNVAASRARDQLWVFHSVQPADLREDDARGLLLTYCQNVTAADEAYDHLEKRCDSDFEREVLRRVLRRGYRPLPQFRIGSYRIDFVLPAPDGRRLAIECDGDAYHGPERWESDMRRQAVLERVGNCVFVRIRGSVFSRDPEAALEPLWQRIEELGIGVAAPQVIAAEVVAPTPPAAASEPGAVEPFVEAEPPVPVVVEVVQQPPVVVEAVPQPSAPAPVPPRQAEEDRAVVVPSAKPEPATAARPADELADDGRVPVPVGYRNVAWLRPYEAVAAMDSYQHCRDVPIRHEGKVLGWARYYDSASPEARKYRANVRVERAHPTGARLVCWVRPHEAKTVIGAASMKRDMPVEDSRGRHAGLVQYFPAASSAAVRFRSVTRLLRLTGGDAPASPAPGAAAPAAPGPAVTGPTGAVPAAREATNGRALEESLRRAMARAYDRAEELPDEAESETADRRALEAAFHDAMVRTYERARDEAHYHAALLLRLVTDKGGLATARQLLHHPVVSDGFTALWERGRVDLTAEAVVIRPRFRALFTEEELAIASSRVVDASAQLP